MGTTAVRRVGRLLLLPGRLTKGPSPLRPQKGFRGLTRAERRAKLPSSRRHPSSRGQPWPFGGRSTSLGGGASQWHFRRRSPTTGCRRPAPDEGSGWKLGPSELGFRGWLFHVSLPASPHSLLTPLAASVANIPVMTVTAPDLGGRPPSPFLATAIPRDSLRGGGQPTYVRIRARKNGRPNSPTSRSQPVGN